MRLYYITDEYAKYLHDYDSKVELNKNQGRPYIGILFELDDFKYFAPLTSPKPKHLKMHNSLDFRKINDGRYGAINFNAMIPVPDGESILIDIDSIEDFKYRSLLKRQFKFIRDDEKDIINTARKLRRMLFKTDDELNPIERKVKPRCCDLQVLEKAYSWGGGFRVSPVYSDHLVHLAREYVKNEQIVSLIEDLRRVEESVRNTAAHEIVSLSEDKIRKLTGGFDTEKIFQMIKNAFKYTGIGVSPNDWHSYEVMNERIVELMDR